MKTTWKELSYKEVVEKQPRKLKKPVKTNFIFRILLKIITQFELVRVRFKCNKINIDKLDKKEPCLILMNHTCFLDLMIVYSILSNRLFNVVTTQDAFVGRNWIMRQIGCFPTVKFIMDPLLVRNIASIIKKKRSVVMFPEAGYTFDGTATVFPKSVAKLVKFLKVPLVTIISHGAHLRQPLFNKLRKRKLQVTCDYKYVLSKEEIANMSEDEIWEVIQKEFSFNEYNYQIENNIIIDEKNRADNLNSVLYKCPHCGSEGKMNGHDHLLECENCGIIYELCTNGELKCLNGETKYNTIPKWYNYEREEVRKEIEAGTYTFDEEVDVIIMKDTYSLYKIDCGGRLTHSMEGFNLKLDNGLLDYTYPASVAYTINSDIYFYQNCDIISIGDFSIQYYCCPKKKDVVVKARLATEEIYKIIHQK